MNKNIAFGRLVKDAEFKNINGETYIVLTLATDVTQKQTNFLNMLYKNSSQKLLECLTKGRKVAVDYVFFIKNENKTSSVSFFVNSLTLC